MNRWSPTEVKNTLSLSLSHTHTRTLGKRPNPREEADSGVHQAEVTTDTHPVARETEDSTEYVLPYVVVRVCVGRGAKRFTFCVLS